MEAAGPGADRRPAQAARAAELPAPHGVRPGGQLRPGHARRAALRPQPAAHHAARGALRHRHRRRPTSCARSGSRADRGVVLDFIDCPDRRLARAAAELVSAEAALPGVARHRGAAPAQLLPAARPAAARPHRRQDRRRGQPDPARGGHDRARSTCGAAWRCCTPGRSPRRQKARPPAASGRRPDGRPTAAAEAAGRARRRHRDRPPGRAWPGRPGGPRRPGSRRPATGGRARPGRTGPARRGRRPPRPPAARGHAAARSPGRPVPRGRCAASAAARPPRPARRPRASRATTGPRPPPGSSRSARSRPGRATVEGRVRAVEIRPVEKNSVLACEISDSTGDLTALFYGRSHIPGIVCGSRVRFRGPSGIRAAAPS